MVIAIVQGVFSSPFCEGLNRSALATESLAGKHLNAAVVEWPPFSFQDADGVWQGYDISVFKELASRAGFTYSFSVYAQGANETWDDVLDRSLESTDVAVTYYSDTAYRRKYRGYVFTHGHVNEGWMLTTRSHVTKPRSVYWSFLEPFSLDLWFAVLALGVFSAVFLWVTEDIHETTITDFFYRAFSSFTGFETIESETYAGRIYNFSFGFCVLIIIASYTANLASILVSSRTDGISSLQVAVNKGVKICAMKGGTVRNTLFDTLA
jgi:hypothetical protein